MKANLSSSQILCWNCEEVVHAYAARCPYCTKDLSVQTKSDNKSDKITQISPLPLAPVVAQEPEKAVVQEAPSSLPDTFTVLVSLAALLAGSFFFFFGVIIKLFAQNGTFVLEWKASSWPYFIGSSLVLICLGLYTVSKLDNDH